MTELQAHSISRFTRILAAAVFILTGGGALADDDCALMAMSASQQALLADHVAALRQNGEDPVRFAIEKLSSYDILVFDDGLHTAAQPFEFYQSLVRDDGFTASEKYVFLEAVPVNRQSALDAYLNAAKENEALLYPAFQDGFGWPYRTYFDLLKTIRDVNKGLSEEKRIKVIGVGTPAMCAEIRTPQDFQIYNDTNWIARDYHMYGMIRAALDGFASGKKGIFLTNTRHAYKNLLLAGDRRVWSATAFFDEWYPGHVYSIRFNTPVLLVKARAAQSDGAATTEGLEGFEFGWGRVADGLWDEAYEHYGAGKPVAIELKGTPFATAPYAGNLMLYTKNGETMGNANDAVIFAGPIEDLKRTAMIGGVYTPAFQKELARRYRVANTPEQLKTLFDQAEVRSLSAYIRKEHASEDETLLPEAAAVGARCAWRSAR